MATHELSLRSLASIRAEEANENRDLGYYPSQRFEKIDRSAPLIRCAGTMPNIVAQVAKFSCQSKPDLSSTLTSEELMRNARLKYSELKIKAEHFLVMHVRYQLVGFLIACGSEGMLCEDESIQQIKGTLGTDKRFVFIKELYVSQNQNDSKQTLYYKNMLMRELYARSIHYYNHEGGDESRPIFARRANENEDFFTLIGFTSWGYNQNFMKCEKVGEYLPSTTRIAERLSGSKGGSPYFDSEAGMDPNCIGVGVLAYAVESPDVKRDFYANVRIVMKWRQPGVETNYNRVVNDGYTRTMIDDDLEIHPRIKKQIRCPRYDFNQNEVEVTESYAYIDKSDPQDVITWHQVLRGSFSGEFQSLRFFPADLQELRFTFRIWDNDPDDRCRYFRQLYYFDNIPWILGVKRKIDSLSSEYLAPQAEIDLFHSGASRYIFKLPFIRRTPYFLRTVGFPITLITSLSFASTNIESFGPKADFNATLLLATVAYVFINKDYTPRGEMTLLDIITYSSLVLHWALIMMRFFLGFKGVEKEISTFLCVITVGIQSVLIIILMTRYWYYIGISEPLIDQVPNQLKMEELEQEKEDKKDGADERDAKIDDFLQPLMEQSRKDKDCLICFKV